MNARRKVLDEVQLRWQSDRGRTHIGLWLDRYLKVQNEQGAKDEQGVKDKEGVGEKARHLLSVHRMPAPAGYPEAYRRSRAELELLVRQGQALLFEAKAEGRIAIGLGDQGVLENGLRLDYTWGVPILPGSALKGVCRAAARRLTVDKDWHEPKLDKDGRVVGEHGPSNRHLFGFTDADGKDANIGRVDFLDAWWIPDGNVPVALDTITVHHPTYYQGDAPPLDTDSPKPIPFATVSGTFLIALVLNRTSTPAEWLDAAARLLQLGLDELGIGAKTNAGYGRVIFDVVEGAAKHARIAYVDSLRSPEERFERDQADVIAGSAAAQADWLLTHALEHPELRATFHARLAAGVEAVRHRADGRDPRIALKQTEIDAHAAKKPSKKDKKKLKSWIKQRDKLAKQLEQLGREQGNRAAEQSKAVEVLAFLLNQA